MGLDSRLIRNLAMPANRNVTELETYSGQYVNLLAPEPASIRLEDIAVGLANTCRYGGQVSRFYSVAEHAVRVSEMVHESYALYALHHDSHEAYIGDVIAPMKKVIRLSQSREPETSDTDAVSAMAWKLDNAIGQALGLEDFHSTIKSPVIKAADDEAMYHEAAALKWSHGVGEHWLNFEARVPWAGIGWSPARAERLFVERHEELTNASNS